jgi:hypothetical protein
MADPRIVAACIAGLVLLVIIWILLIARDQSERSPRRPTANRRSYEESCRELQRQAVIESGAVPCLPKRRPNFDDSQLGVHFFKTRLADNVIENLTLPRTFFGRTQIDQVTFRNTNLSESVLCWNDFDGVDFTNADLSGCDLRGSIFKETLFVSANLERADLRHSTFKACDFRGANLRGAKLTRKGGAQIPLSTKQRRSIDWQDSEGPEPPGG